MSEEHSSNSVYGSDSTPEYSEPPISEASIIKDKSELHSSGSSIDLSIAPSEADLDNSLIGIPSKQSVETQQSVSSKIDSVKSLWSVSDASPICKNGNCRNQTSNETRPNCTRKHLLPNDVSPFVYDGRFVKYNVERGVQYDTPLLIGSRKLSTKECKDNNSASHLLFNPKTGTLIVGHNPIDNWTRLDDSLDDSKDGFNRLGNYSLIAGLDNLAELDASFISGSHNSIRLKMLPGSNDQINDEYCFIPPSCAIVGGNQNSITNTSVCGGSSAIIASSNIHIEDCEEAVFLGLRPTPDQQPFRGWKQAAVAQNLFGLGRVHAGPMFGTGHTGDSVLEVNGNTYVAGNMSADGNINAETATFTSVMATTGTFQNINITNIVQQAIYLTGVSGGFNHTVSRGDGINVIYANPAPGNVNIILEDVEFEPNRVLFIKDTSLEYGAGSSNSIYISVPMGVRIEIYGTTGGTGATGSFGIIAREAGTYVVTSSGGSVTLRYMEPDIRVIGSLPTWVIENQLVGNPRLLPSTGISFIPASYNTRARVLRRRS